MEIIKETRFSFPMLIPHVCMYYVNQIALRSSIMSHISLSNSNNCGYVIEYKNTRITEQLNLNILDFKNITNYVPLH